MARMQKNFGWVVTVVLSVLLCTSVYQNRKLSAIVASNTSPGPRRYESKIMTHLKKIKQDEVPMGGNIFTDKGKAAPVVITPQKVVTQCDCTPDCPYCEKESRSHTENYEKYCSTHFTPEVKKKRNYCACVPETLVGYEKPEFSIPMMSDLMKNQGGFMKEGSWAPPICKARHRVAIIIPFRDRQDHLKVLLKRLVNILQRQKMAFTIFVVQQADDVSFNKGLLMNIGFEQANAVNTYDCYIYHDADLWPENDRNVYACVNESPRHVSSSIDTFAYQLPTPNFFGGVVAFTKSQFNKVNGFSNKFYGWGGEDDDIYYRIKEAGMTVRRYSAVMSRYAMMKHKQDRITTYKNEKKVLLARNGKDYLLDGLSTMKYKLESIVRNNLYILIKVSVPKHL